MTDTFDLVLHGGVCATPAGLVVTDIGVRDGRIAALGDLDPQRAAEAIDCRGLHVLPGLIDSQVHFREPGGQHKEDLATGSDAAILGGVTTVFEMPNTSPSTVTVDALQDKLRRAAGRMRCDHAFFIGATGDNGDELLAAAQAPGCAGTKIFIGSSTGDLLVEGVEKLDAALAASPRRTSAHCENEARLRERKAIADAAGHPRAHPVWRDEEAAITATRLFVDRARIAGRRAHVLHVTTGEEAAYLATVKDVATMELTPHHLTLAGPEAYERLGTLVQMNPPVRDDAHQAALWRAVADGTADVLGSDHAPHTLEEKAKPYPTSPSGMPGVQTTLPVMLTHVDAGKLSLMRFVDLMCAGPGRIFGLAHKGRIAAGFDADFAIVDLKAEWRLENAQMASRCGWTPYDGMRVVGRPVATILRGGVAMRDGALLGEPFGAPVAFHEAYDRNPPETP